MSAIDTDVQEILERTLARVRRIRVANNDEDQDQVSAAHETFAELFALGMIDRWQEEEAEEGEDTEPPTPQTWDWNCEPLAPAEAWSAETRARFHQVCGDLNLLHSNDAGLNAAKDNYEEAAPALRAIDSVAAVLCHARMLRAAAYASYGADVIQQHVEGLAWAAEVARGSEPAVRDEFELSLIEMSARMLVGATAEVADTPFGELLRSVLHGLCARGESLPFRRAVPWLALGLWAPGPLFGPERLAPFLELTGTRDLGALLLRVADRAVAAEDGTFYPHGGALPPDQYIESTASEAAGIRLGGYAASGAWREAHDLAVERLGQLGDWHHQQRLELQGIRLRALARLGDDAAWRVAAADLLAWLEENRTAYWWDFYEVPSLLDEVQERATALGDAAVTERLEQLRRPPPPRDDDTFDLDTLAADDDDS